MHYLNSIVIKLWFTIILIVTTVLIILSVALVGFFNSYFISETGKTLYQQANKIESILMSRHNQSDAIDYVKELIENPAGLVIIENKKQLDDNYDELKQIMVDEIHYNPSFKAVFEENKHVTKMINVNYQNERHRYILLGFPSQAFEDKGAIILFQDINSISSTLQYVSIIILVSALVLILLSTIFAFFLSNKITKPLLMLKQSAFQVARGERSDKVKTTSRDEIGELTVAFNKMESDIRSNIASIETERNLRDKLINAMADGVLSYELDIDQQLMNPMAERFLDIIDSGQHDELQQTFNEVLKDNMTKVLEVSTKNHFFVVIVSPVRRAALNNKSGAVALIRDMTEEHRNDEMKKRFVADVSHELRTPIQMLQGYTEALLDDIVETPEEQKEFLNIILDESKRLNRLVNELLNVARFDAGDVRMEIKEVNIHTLLLKVKATFNQAIVENDIQVTIQAAPSLNWHLDEDKMIQVLTNLMDNAIRYTHRGDSIEIVAEGHETLMIQMNDSGVGIDEQHLPHLFDRFYKVDEARTRGKNGTGLGLFIVKSIIESHGGTISAESKKGEGTTFTILIPYR
ncbi:HAMP domain-containing protein [Macrococcus hajekii]|uniref:Sensor protein SrrB n=1 Tax=Macrococcus hajekii TaxID=198482 RepID=A0A4V6PPP9_9STAP|nr:ATP-binding protein [Macrococcus hajekii]TDM02965.1 HAMP domain-containing protein [Macrococcus hajekii]GGB05420.1 sensor protein SrrB [Macrococcus hajekii]